MAGSRTRADVVAFRRSPSGSQPTRRRATEGVSMTADWLADAVHALPGVSGVSVSAGRRGQDDGQRAAVTAPGLDPLHFLTDRG